MRLPYLLLHYNLFYMYLRLRHVVLKILKANMYFWANARCRIENYVEKAAVFILPLYIIGLKIVPRDNRSRTVTIIEPPHDKTNKVAMRPTKTQIAKDPAFLHADSEYSDQTGRITRLI